MLMAGMSSELAGTPLGVQQIVYTAPKGAVNAGNNHNTSHWHGWLPYIAPNGAIILY